MTIRRISLVVPPLWSVTLIVWLAAMAAAPGSTLGEDSAAKRVAPGDTPLNLVETGDGFLVSTNSGYGAHYLLAYDEARREVTDRLEFPSLWYGLDDLPRQKSVLASAGAHSVLVVPLRRGKFGKARTISLERCELTAGVAVLDSTTALVACNRSYEVIRFNFMTGRLLGRVAVGEFPYGVKVLPSGRVAVSNWGSASVSILDARDLKILRTIPVGNHPNDMLVLPERRQVFVACSDSDLISVIDLESLREVRRVSILLPDSKLGGAQPDALSFDSATGKLFVALAAINAVAVLDVSNSDQEPKFDGLIPVGAYPTALLHSRAARALYVADGRNLISGPSAPHNQSNDVPSNAHRPRHTHQTDSGARNDYIGYLLGGGIETIADADLEGLRGRMRTLAQQVYGEDPQLSSRSRELLQYFCPKINLQAPIRYVIYVIKENRTYDQVLGDMREGNGAPELVLFGESVTPNHHALARQFVLFDNFYVDGDVSADGHVWSTAASSTDYVNKLWPSFYARRLNYDFVGPDYDGDDQHDQPLAIPASGFIWDLAGRSDVSYRDYGEWCVDEDNNAGVTRCYVRGLKDNYDPNYLDGIGTVSDQKRLEEWEREFREFEKNGALPQLTIMHLPNDHTVGTQPGRPTPRAMVADNDLALGHLVEVVSHSRYWPRMAIFVLEDDAQDGPDHVDAHRSPLLVISPFVRRRTVEHAHFSTASVLKTIEQILGLPSLTYFDDRAPSLLDEFQREPLLDTYTALPARTPLDERNAPNAQGAQESARWDFSRPDRTPDQELNRVIWKSVKGADSEPPAPVFHLRPATPAVTQVTLRE